MTLNAALDAASVRKSHDRCSAPSSVFAGVSGSVGALLKRRWSSTQKSATPALKR